MNVNKVARIVLKKAHDQGHTWLTWKMIKTHIILEMMYSEYHEFTEKELKHVLWYFEYWDFAPREIRYYG